MVIDVGSIQELDDELRAEDPVQALALRPDEPDRSLASPLPFICDDGRAYWVKGKTQGGHGLEYDLIGGRLAALAGAGPGSTVVHVDPTAHPPGLERPDLLGTVVGTLDVPGTKNSKRLQEFLGDGSFDPGVLSDSARALTIAFQTWIGLQDEQLLVRLTDGMIFSIDYGAAFTDKSDPLRLTIANLPGAPSELGRDWQYLRPAVEKIKAISDEQIMRSVARIPSDDGWDADVNRRYKIACYVSERREQLEESVTAWLQ